MLRELHISNLAVIEDARLELGSGLNCFTGQTGAGKSLILGAFELLLGLRQASADLLRAGTEEARVSGIFEVCDRELAAHLAQVTDLEIAVGDELLITRRVSASGRSTASLNGRPATAAMLREIGQMLVDVHGQHDHQYLLKPANQLLILDEFAKATELRRQFAELFDRRRQLAHRRDELKASGTLRRQQLELYEFQAQEIDQAKPAEGEYTELKARHSLLSNLRRITREAGAAQAALYEADGSICERLQMVGRILQELAELDARLAPIAEQIRSANLTLNDSSFELRRYVERLDLDPAELAEIEERLNTLNRLIAKYADGGRDQTDDPLAVVLTYRHQLEQQITALRGDDQDLHGIDGQIHSLEHDLKEAGAQLTTVRRAAAQRLQPLVDAELRELGMAEAQLHVEFIPPEADEPAGSRAGMESVEFFIRTNPGQPARPLRKIASGGEMSRTMLALKSVLAQADRVSVLVFDEIDANVGGRLGTVIGRKLRKLASGQGHQVLCITHLPQIAAFADQHLHIAKSVMGRGAKKQTQTTVTTLIGDRRIEELAEMLAGTAATGTTRKQARELIDAAS